VDEPALQEQMRYYQERAAEYDASVLGDGADAGEPLAQELRAWPPNILARLAPCEQALELACGTGVWTRELLSVARYILALDASPAMLALNRAKVADARVRYQLADLFAWEADAPVDLAFAALWFSHVPTHRLAPMLSALRRAVRPGGQLCVIDEPESSPVRPPAREDADLELRALRNGRQFQIVKIYRAPQQLAAFCRDAGFTQTVIIPGTYFFGLIAQ
jgi:demethylmenaquinone methyltransferase/2-methoxy-6-polyprenyl-1,4-benzoquinol methylase